MKCVLLHGLGQTPQSWRSVLKDMRWDGEVETPNVFAFQGANCTYEALYQAFQRRYEAERTPFHLCGLSLGGVMALQYALEHPEKVISLTLIGTPFRMPKGLLRLQNGIFRLLPAPFFQKMGLSKRQVLTLTRSMMGVDFRARLSQLRCPALIVCGERDRANLPASKELAALLPSAVFRPAAGAGHEVNVQAPRALSGMLCEFWRETAGEDAL